MKLKHSAFHVIEKVRSHPVLHKAVRHGTAFANLCYVALDFFDGNAVRACIACALFVFIFASFVFWQEV
jgi:hypothetical protein